MTRRFRFLLALAFTIVSARADTFIGVGSGGGFGTTAQFIQQTYASEQMAYCKVASSDVAPTGAGAGLACSGIWQPMGVYGAAPIGTTFAAGSNAAFNSAAITPGAGGWNGLSASENETQFGNNFAFAAKIALGGTTAVRVWVGVSPPATNGLNAVAGVIASTPYGNRFVGLNYDSAVRPTWQCCAGNQANYNCVNTGATADTGWHVMAVNYPVNIPAFGAADLTCTIDGVTTTLPASSGFTPAQGTAGATDSAQMHLTITSLDAGLHTLNYSWLTLITY